MLRHILRQRKNLLAASSALLFFILLNIYLVSVLSLLFCFLGFSHHLLPRKCLYLTVEAQNARFKSYAAHAQVCLCLERCLTEGGLLFWPVRPGSHGCKIWLFAREALQFPWILQQNLEAAARSEKRPEGQLLALLPLQQQKKAQAAALAMWEVMWSRGRQVSFFSFLFFFYWEKRTFSANEDLFE